MTTPPLQPPSLLAVHQTSEVTCGHELRGFPWLCAAFVTGGVPPLRRPFLPFTPWCSPMRSGDV